MRRRLQPWFPRLTFAAVVLERESPSLELAVREVVGAVASLPVDARHLQPALRQQHPRSLCLAPGTRHVVIILAAGDSQTQPHMIDTLTRRGGSGYSSRGFTKLLQCISVCTLHDFHMTGIKLHTGVVDCVDAHASLSTDILVAVCAWHVCSECAHYVVRSVQHITLFIIYITFILTLSYDIYLHAIMYDDYYLCAWTRVCASSVRDHSCLPCSRTALPLARHDALCLLLTSEPSEPLSWHGYSSRISKLDTPCTVPTLEEFCA